MILKEEVEIMAKDELQVKIAKKRKSITICILLLLITILVFLFLNSNYFIIKKINIYNNKFVSKDEIMVLSQINKENIFFINRKKIIQNIRNNPYVEDVEVTKKLPSTLNIKIKEKEIRGIVKLKDGFINVDKEGRMVQIVNKFPDCKIPLIEGIKIKQYTYNDYVSGYDNIKKDALKNVLSINGYKECKSIFYSINIYDPYNIILTTKNGVQIKIGDCTNLEYKLGYAMTILKNPSIKKFKGSIQIQPDGIAVFKKN